MAVTLSDVKKTHLKPPRILIHGQHGMGKTTFASQAPRPVFIQTEDGEGNLELQSFGAMKTFSDVLSAIDSLLTGSHEFKTVVVDSLDHLEPLIWTHLCAIEGVSSIEKVGGGYGKGFNEALTYWGQVINALTRLRDEKKMTIIMTAHTDIKRYEPPDTEAYDRYQIALHKKAASFLQEICDCVLFATQKVITTSDDTGFNKKHTRGITIGKRVIYTQERPAHDAKNRYGLPEEILLSWSSFSNALIKNSQSTGTK